ncbi:hypothetical protein N9Q43_00800 [bacterium]|nr:hypothetical protein [bacterium]
MDSKIDTLRTRRAQATIDNLNQYLQDNIGADDLVDSLQDMIKFLNQFIFENKTDNFDLKKYLSEGKLYEEDNLKDYWSEWAAGEVKVGNDGVIDAGGVDADFKDVPDDTMDTFKRYVKAVKTLNASSKELRDDIAVAISGIFYDGGGFEDYEFDVLTSDQFDKIK